MAAEPSKFIARWHSLPSQTVKKEGFLQYYICGIFCRELLSQITRSGIIAAERTGGSHERQASHSNSGWWFRRPLHGARTREEAAQVPECRGHPRQSRELLSVYSDAARGRCWGP